MDPRRNAWKVTLIVGISAVAGYFVLPGATSQDIAYSLFGLASVVCILIGVRLNRPADRLGWYLVAIAGACFALGDGTSNVCLIILHVDLSTPSLADAWYLAGYPFLFAGVLRLTRGSRSQQRDDVLDAVIVSVAALTFSWHFLMNPYFHDSSIGSFGKLVTMAYPIMDIALIYIVLRRLLFAASNRPSQWFLASALTTMFIGDFAYDLLVLHSSYSTGNFTDAFFLVEYVLIAVAALHPSMGEMASDTRNAVVRDHRSEADARRLPLVTIAALIPPVLLLAGSSLGLAINVPVLAALTVIEIVLVLIRGAGALRLVGVRNLEIQKNVRALEESHLQRDVLENDLRYHALHDPLTGLANRDLLHDRVGQALASTTRSGKSVALCFGDLDGFKNVNDTLGHNVGDRVLIKVGRDLASIVRPSDTVARLGGDEFAILMTDLERPEAAVDFAHRIVSVVRGVVDLEGNQFDLSISVGLAFGGPTKGTDQLISEADAAMYEAKARGKDCVEVFRSEMRYDMLERLDFTSRFHGALARSEFFLEYQPIFSLADQRLRGFEALVRWQHPTMGLIAPLRFIPIAEETGFIIPLGRWLLIEACRRLAAWNQCADEPLSIWVNLSRRQLMSPALADQVRTALELSGIGADQLVLEITESVLMDNPGRAAAVLYEIRAAGIRIAVDDFGTGYSSLSHLRQFPVDVLKIDKSFVDSLDYSDPMGSALVPAIIDLARNLGLHVVAEGIEHEAQLQRLIDLGCENGQGFLMARPLDHEDVELLINAHAGSATRARSRADSSCHSDEDSLRPPTRRSTGWAAAR